MIDSLSAAGPSYQAAPVRQAAAPAPAPVQPQGGSKLESAGPGYVSPNLRIDAQTQQAVIEYRNFSTGEVENQYPTKNQLAAYARQDLGQSHLLEASS